MGEAVLSIRSWADRKIHVTNGVTDVITQQLSASKERVVIDLSVGDRFEPDGGSETKLQKSLTIKPGQVVRIRTQEEIVTPADVFGLVVSKATLAGDGLFVSNIKIDPNFNGPLRIAVYNASRQRIVCLLYTSPSPRD